MAVSLGDIEAKLKLDKKGFDRGMSSASKGLNKLRTGAIAAGAAVGTMAVALGTKAVKASANFEQSITEAGIKVQATEAQLDKMADAAISAGQASKFGASEAADAMTFLGQAGFSAAEQIEALPSVLSLASAENMNVAKTADIASNIMQGFGKSASDMADISDTLVKASQSANTNVGELGQAMSFAAPEARSMGIDINEAAAAVGALSDAGVKSGRAGRGLRMMLTKLSEAGDKLGVEVSNASIQVDGLTGTMQKLEKAGLNAENATDLFGARAGSTAGILLQRGIPAVEELTEKIEDNAGAAQSAADKQLDTLQGKYDQLTGSIDVALTKMGDDGLNSVMKNLTDTMRSHADEVSNAEDSWEQFFKTLPQAGFDALRIAAAGPLPFANVEDEAREVRSERSIQSTVNSLIKSGDLKRPGFSIPGQEEFTADQITEALNQRRARESELNRSNFFAPESPGDASNVFGLDENTQTTDQNTKETQDNTQAVKNLNSTIQTAGRKSSVDPSGAISAARGSVSSAASSSKPGIDFLLADGAKEKSKRDQEAKSILNEGFQDVLGSKQAKPPSDEITAQAEGFDDMSRNAFRAADSVTRLEGALEQSATGGRKLSSALGGILGGAQTAIAGGGNPLSLIAGGAQALGGIIGAFSGGNDRTARNAQQLRQAKQRIEEFADRTAERLGEEMERRDLRPIIAQVSPGVLVGSDEQASRDLADMVQSELERRG